MVSEPKDDGAYSGLERSVIEELPIEMIEAFVERIATKVINKHAENERAMLDELIKKAFPNGDPESHRDYHQAKIDAAEAEKEFYQTLKIKLAEAGALGVLKLILWLLAVGFSATIAAKFGMLPAFLASLGGK